MSTLQFVWFGLIGLLFAIFFFLEGFDFGVGMSIGTLTKSEKEVDQAMATIGPVWDGNEVWLLTAGGAMFASMPYWYASLFSAYYLMMFIILIGLILRGSSFEFRATHPDAAHKKLWGRLCALGSFIAPFTLGMVFTSFIQGIPLDGQGNATMHFFNYVNWLSIVGGVAVALLCYMHGLNYIALRTEGELRDRAKKYANILYYILYAGEVVFAILLFVFTDFGKRHLVGTLIFLALIVLLTVIAHISVMRGAEKTAFITSGLTLVAVVVLIFQGIYPYVMIGKDGVNSILIKNATSSPYTLQVMTIVALCTVPIVLAYTIWTYWVFSKRITADKIPAY